MQSDPNADAYFADIAAERLALADVLGELTAQQWQTQSLCSGWTVEDVAAHLVLPFVTPMWRFGIAMVRFRGNFHRANKDLTRRTREKFAGQFPKMLRDNARHRFTPPGQGPLAPLTDIIVHGQDIRRPLGIGYDIPEERLRTVLGFVSTPSKDSPFSVQVDGVKWTATDLDWSYGDGAVVQGPAMSLLLAITGRRDAVGDLAGPGAERVQQSLR